MSQKLNQEPYLKELIYWVSKIPKAYSTWFNTIAQVTENLKLSSTSASTSK
ncbi:hypothetical protein LXL04_008049 [Taraxacum kok-saghyz]